MKTPLVLIALAVVLSSCVVINRPRCKDHELTAFDPWPHQGTWSAGVTSLPYSTWLPASPKHPKAVVILAQGWDSSGRDYESIGRRLAGEGYAVYSSENRCGKYDKRWRRGATPAIKEDWVHDLEDFTAFARKQHPELPFFYHGHSMGCLVAIEAAKALQGDPLFKGLILHSPGFPLMSESTRPALNAVLFPIGWIRVPHLLFIDPEKDGPFGDPEMNCRWLKSNDRVKRGYQLEFVRKAAALGHEARLDSRGLKSPVLAIGGGKDLINTRDGRLKAEYHSYLSDEIAGGHAQLRFYDEGYHVLTETPTKERALDDIVSFLDEQYH